MKKTLKCLSVIIVMLIILFSFSITALAQTTTQDGLQVNLTTDKQSYSLNEDIQITISVTNTNDFTVKDVSIEALLPDKFELKDSNDETSTKAIDLKSGEQANLTVVAVVKGEEQNVTNPTESTVEPNTEPNNTTEPTTKPIESNTGNTQNTKSNTQTTTSIISNNDNNKSDKSDDNTKNNNNQDNTSIKTGSDYTYMGIFIVLLLASISTLLYCLIKHFDKTTKIVSSILCVVIAVTSVVGISKFNAFAQENNSSTITVSEHIKVDNNNYTITVNVGYKEISNSLSKDDISKMTEVDTAIDNLIKSDDYKSLEEQEKASAIKNLLIDLSKQSLIKRNSIKYYSDTKQFGFIYDCGVTGGIYISNFDCVVLPTEFNNSSQIRSFLTASNDKRKNKNSDISAVTMYGYDEPTKDERFFKPFDDYTKNISTKGIISSIYDCPTVSDFKTKLVDAEIICIGEHGTYDEETNTYCFVVGGELANEENDNNYNEDIVSGRILRRYSGEEEIYCITPKFFSYYYNNGKLNDAIVIMTFCMGFGEGNITVDYDFAKAFINKCDASTVLGFHNSVMSFYSIALTNEFTQNMILGYTAEEAFDITTKKLGMYDNDYAYNKNFEIFQSEWWYTRNDEGKTGKDIIDERPAAFPILFGNKNKTININRGKVSGGVVKDSKTNNPIKDVRVEVIDNSSDSFDPVVTTTTDENGNFSLNLPYGSYSLSFHHDNYNYYGMSLDVDSEYVVLQNPVLLNPTTSESLIQNNDIVTFTGALKTEDYEINSNNKGTVTILDLDNPIKSYLKDGNNYDGKTEYYIESVQISSPNLKEYIGQNVTVKGKVMLAHTAHHRRDVVLLESEVIKLNSIENYKEDFINALLENEDEWYVNWGASVGYQSELTFTDLNFDGKPEFIMQYGGGSMRNNNASAYYFSNNKLFEANTWFQNNLTAYYDKSNNSYVMLGNAYAKDGVNYWWCGDFELSFDGINIISDYYSSYIAEDLNYTGNFIYTYYNGANGYGDVNGLSKITETEYNKINEEKLKNLVNINMKREFILCSDWEKYSASEKRQALEKAYDSFTYDKY